MSKKWIFITIGTVVVALLASTVVLSILLARLSRAETNDYRDVCYPLVLAHRGASGYVPEHTLGAYALAITMGADYVEPDLVMTSDGQLVALHENDLGLTTNVADHTEFASRYRTQSVDGTVTSSWFSEDFTLEEIKTLRAIERTALIRPGNARMDNSFEVPTLQEIIDLVKSMELVDNRVIGIVPEIKHPTHFQRLGLAMEAPIVEVFRQNGYTSASHPVLIQSFEVNNLRELRELTDIRLVQLISGQPGSTAQPFDQLVGGTGLTYGSMATAAGLREVATYAFAVGPNKNYVIPRNADNTLGQPTTFVQNAHAVGLEVHPYTFRAENVFLPLEFRSNVTGVGAIGNLAGELQAFFDAGVDAVFADQPDIPVRVRSPCY